MKEKKKSDLAVLLRFTGSYNSPQLPWCSGCSRTSASGLLHGI